MSQAELLAALATASKKHVDQAAPSAARMMAAKGLVPLPPREMVLVLCVLLHDGDSNVAAAARQSLGGLPDKILQPTVESGLPPAALAALAPVVAHRDEVLQKIALQRATPDDALVAVAGQASAAVAEIIASNQERCMRCEALVRALRTNSNLLKSSSDRLFDFLVRAGVIYDDMPEFAAAMERLSPSEALASADKVALPGGLEELIETGGGVAVALNESDADAAAPTPETPLTDQELEALAAAEQTEEAEQAGPRVSIQKLINGLNVAQKVALALKGNREARMILVRDNNRLVASAAIRSPRITEQEIAAAARSRSVSDEVLRIISGSKQMMRAYAVKVALVNNPRTALAVAMRLLPALRQNDLKMVARSKGISAALVAQAKRMVKGDKDN